MDDEDWQIIQGVEHHFMALLCYLPEEPTDHLGTGHSQAQMCVE